MMHQMDLNLKAQEEEEQKGTQLPLDSNLGEGKPLAGAGGNAPAVEELGSPAMDSSRSQGLILDVNEAYTISMEEAKRFMDELYRCSEHSAISRLQRVRRLDLSLLLSIEMGKEKKPAGLTKQKLIDLIMSAMSKKRSRASPLLPPFSGQPIPKRQRKTDHPRRLALGTGHLYPSNIGRPPLAGRYCPNRACMSRLGRGAEYCKLCSCCICHEYDEIKDPTLWLICGWEKSSSGESCGKPCHVQCIIRHERSGIAKDGHSARLDGAYCCVNCGKENSLLSCWRKQLMIARDARRVDVLCYRVSLSYKLLCGTEKYQSLHSIVDTAREKLQAEVGPLDSLPLGTSRGIVRRLSVGGDVQKLCAWAIESLDSVFDASRLPFGRTTLIAEPCLSSSKFIKFEDVTATSVSVVLCLEETQELSGYSLWHRKFETPEYSQEATCSLQGAASKVMISELAPSTLYMFKIIAFKETMGAARELAKWECAVRTKGYNLAKGLALGVVSPETPTVSNPFSECYASNNTIATGGLIKSPDGSYGFNRKIEIDLEKPADYYEKEVMQQIRTPAPLLCNMNENPKKALVQAESSEEQKQATEFLECGNEVKTPAGNELMVLQTAGKMTPSYTEPLMEPEQELQPVDLSKNGGIRRFEEFWRNNVSSEEGLDYCMKAVRWLECEGLIEVNFRVKFLTWFGMHASPEERKVVSIYVETLQKDPVSLAAQLVDTFSEVVLGKKPLAEKQNSCPDSSEKPLAEKQNSGPDSSGSSEEASAH